MGVVKNRAATIITQQYYIHEYSDISLESQAKLRHHNSEFFRFLNLVEPSA